MIEELRVFWTLKLVLDETRVHKVHKLDGEVHIGLARIQSRWVTVNHLLKLLEHGIPFWVGETTSGQLDEGYA